MAKRKKSITVADVKAAPDPSLKEVLSRRGRAARRKGQQSERDIAALVRRVFPDAKRGIGQARFGRECPDVDGTPYWIETKCGKNAPVRSALKQAVDDTDGRTPVVIVKDDRCEPFVVMRLSDWLDDLWSGDDRSESPVKAARDARADAIIHGDGGRDGGAVMLGVRHPDGTLKVTDSFQIPAIGEEVAWERAKRDMQVRSEARYSSTVAKAVPGTWVVEGLVCQHYWDTSISQHTWRVERFMPGKHYTCYTHDTEEDRAGRRWVRLA